MSKYSTNEKSYLFSLDYRKRMEEKTFIRDVLERYDRKKLVGTGIWVNNNPYNFEFYFFLNFVGDISEFENWLKQNYNDKERKYNFFIGDIISSFGDKTLTGVSGIDSDMLDFTITPYEGHPFLFPEEKIANEIRKGGLISKKPKVFLSHSSKDKEIVDMAYEQLVRSGIVAWYDKYEIDSQENIVMKIGEGLEESDFAVFFLSKNFLESKSGWTIAELDYFIQERLKLKRNNFICINIDLEHKSLPPLVQEYKYLEFDRNHMGKLIKILKKRVPKNND